MRRRDIHTLTAALLMAGAFALQPLAAHAASGGGAVDVDQIARETRASVVTVFAQRTLVRQRGGGVSSRRLHTRVGSGVAVEDGLVLTTASVILGAERVMVRTVAGVQVEGRVTGMDLVYNLALVEVDGIRLPVISFADRPAQPGDWVMALGTSYRGQPTQSVGNVATIYPDPRQPLLQLTNTVYPGNSGGAALNARGELIGLVQGELGSPEPAGRGPDSDRRPGGMSFVQPVQTLRGAYEALRRDGRVAHGYLGVSTRSASVESDAEPGVRVPIGALVEHVQPDGPAMKVGIQRGDLMVGFDRERVEYADHLARWVASTAPGIAIDLVWVRNDIQHQAVVTLGASPDAAPQWAVAPSETAVPASTSPPRIEDLERQIQQLNHRLKRLRGDSTSGTR